MGNRALSPYTIRMYQTILINMEIFASTEVSYYYLSGKI